MVSSEVRLTHPNDRLAKLAQEHRQRADSDRIAAANNERRGTELFQRAARLRLEAMEKDQVADRIASLLSPVAGLSPIAGEPLTAGVAKGSAASFTRGCVLDDEADD